LGTINNFIKECKKLFGDDIAYKATSQDGVVFKNKWKDSYDTVESKSTESKQFIRENKST
jgi:hypothetical protein